MNPAKQPSPNFPRTTLGLSGLLALALLLASCGHAHGPRVTPIALPSAKSRGVNVQGAQVQASPYADRDQAETAFGFDIRGAGLFPVRFTLSTRAGLWSTSVPSRLS